MHFVLYTYLLSDRTQIPVLHTLRQNVTIRTVIASCKTCSVMTMMEHHVMMVMGMEYTR